MPELREVFDMTTKQIDPDLDAWREQERRQRRSSRNGRIGAFAVVALIAIGVAVVVIGSLEGDPTQPAGEPSTTARPTDPRALAVATQFIDAFADLDAARANALVADEAFPGFLDDLRSRGDARLFFRLLAAQDFQYIGGTCEPLGATTSGTQVRCPFAFHLLGSREIGLSPYEGSYVALTMRKGLVVSASISWEISRFSTEMWEPFAAWVSEHHSEDAARMYNDDFTNWSLTPASIRLWDRHTDGYAAATTGDA